MDMNSGSVESVVRRSVGWAGFSLIELMIVLVILAIVVAIAVPTYNLEMQQSRRTEARTAVLELAGREEKYFSTNNSYTNDPTLLGYAPVGSGAEFPQSTGTYYQIAVPAVTATTYLITATPSAGSLQNSDTACTSFSVDQLGNQTATGTLGNACWQQ
jgi:type IV pilus assembly protein PilE